jgi:vanillate/3-O-methylgallate O-demethylase
MERKTHMNAKESLEDKLQHYDRPLTMLRTAPVMKYVFPIADEYTNWRDEQAAWKDSAVLFDQSFHMTDIYFKGPDVKRLFSDVGVNNLDGFGKNKAKQFLAVNHDGYVIADAILFGFDDDHYSLVGTPVAPNWVAYHAETGGYDVEVTRDDHTPPSPNKKRLTFRYQLNGPVTEDIVAKAHGGPLEHIKFFRMGEFTIAGRPVRALNHTMSGVPGREMTGLEIIGHAEDKDAVLDALLQAGQEFGLRQGGVRSYISATYESGWIPSPVPAIYSSDQTRPYRQWLSAMTFEGHASIAGSFDSDKIEDYYQTPWDLGYGRLVKFDHDFIGRPALERMADQPHRRKVWLRWNQEDVTRIIADGMFGTGERPKFIDLPNASWAHFEFDAVLGGDQLIGLSTYAGYTVNIGGVVSVAMVDETHATDGTEVTLLWGQTDGGRSKLFVEPHVQTTIRATISTTSPV